MLYLAVLFLSFSLPHMFILYWMHRFANLILCGPMFVYNTLMFWPWLYCNLFGTHSTKCLILIILFDPEGGGISNQSQLRNAIYNINCICPLLLKLNVFSTYQDNGAYAHLHHSSAEYVSLLIKEASGLSLPKIWGPLHLTIPYHHFSQVLFKPPDCCLAQLTTIALLIVVYSIPVLRGAMYLTYICLWTTMVPTGAQLSLNHNLGVSSGVHLCELRFLPLHKPDNFWNGLHFVHHQNLATCIISNVHLLLLALCILRLFTSKQSAGIAQGFNVTSWLMMLTSRIHMRCLPQYMILAPNSISSESLSLEIS